MRTHVPPSPAVLVPLLLLLLCVFPGPAGASSDLQCFTGLEGELKIAGGTTHIPVMEEAARRIMEFNPKIHIRVTGGGSSKGIELAGTGAIDIGNTGRRPTVDEITRHDLQLYLWAMDGVAVVVHPDNPVRSLDTAQLQDIYSGAVTNWKELGGRDQPVTLYTRDQGSGTRKCFWRKALRRKDMSSAARVVASNRAMHEAVQADPGAIGYLAIDYLDDHVVPVELNGVTPSQETVRNGQYPVVRGLYSVTKGAPKELARHFLEFLYSPTGREIIRDKGLIPK